MVRRKNDLEGLDEILSKAFIAIGDVRLSVSHREQGDRNGRLGRVERGPEGHVREPWRAGAGQGEDPG